MTVTDDPPTAASPDPAAERPRRRGPWLVLAALTALSVTVPIGLDVAGVQLERSSDTSVALPPHALRTVEVDATSAAVTVRAAAGGGRVRLRKDLHWTLARPRVHTEWRGDTLRLKVACGDGPVTTFGLCDADVTLSVPPNVAVKGTTNSGSLAVRGMAGDVDLVDHSGSLELEGLSGPVRARVGSGSLQGVRLSSGSVEVATGSGSIDLAFSKPPGRVTARTGSGSLDLTVPAGSRYAITGHTGSGSPNIAQGIADYSSPDRLDLTAGSGSIDVHY
ncbi:hypothetical protein DZF91_03795 [Actinomadura logoneensis]|uniref:DUF4097 domain-containing protein n=1 Tax=Actinomadura logoneensis TaxID=2293572 RepID=A0A372JSF7_9ACTN|nr:DUF4097 family beta strand repeat-containing protein [Actinomadura logoneensis]RFU42962.1 hypothetical protein DZF91_03795 [Actinomadura logoneensis]